MPSKHRINAGAASFAGDRVHLLRPGIAHVILRLVASRRSADVPSDYPTRVRRLRERLGLTQVELAARLWVAFATVNRWENGQTAPSPLSWSQLLRMDEDGSGSAAGVATAVESPSLDFTGSAEAIRALVEGERLSFGHLFNPAFATEISQIDPLPHQRIAVYEHMLRQFPLRCLLADDAGAGKTIMTGLYLREMKARRLLRRVLIVPPAGLVGNWQRELRTLFDMDFRIITGADARTENPFIGNGSNLLIVSVDTLAGPRMFARLREQGVLPYDLVVLDEAHKLSADRGADLRVRKTDRYRLAEALAGVTGLNDAWRLREDLEREAYCRLLPGYVRQFIENAAPLIGLDIEGDMDAEFALAPASPGAGSAVFHALDAYPADRQRRLTVVRPDGRDGPIWVHPGEPVFERFRATVSDQLGDEALRGAVFIDPTAERPYLFHLALTNVVRQADPELPDLANEEAIECRLVGVRQYEGSEVVLCPVEHLLLLKAGRGLPGAAAQRLAHNAPSMRDQAEAFVTERVARDLAAQRRRVLLDTLPEREQFMRRGFDYQEAELAAARVKQSEKARSGNAAAAKTLKEVKDQQRSLAERRRVALTTIHREPELIAPGRVTFLAHALVVPSADPEDRKRHDAEVERIAVELAAAYEEAAGATVKDVSTSQLARAAGLADNPGFDLLAIYENGERRAIEVKGRAGTGDVEVSSNEWARAANLREGYWLYAVYECATPAPRLVRVRDPFGTLLAKAKGSVLISAAQVAVAAEGNT